MSVQKILEACKSCCFKRPYGSERLIFSSNLLLRDDLRQNLTYDPTVALGVGNYLLCATYRPIIFCLSAKFRLICFSSFWPGLGLPSKGLSYHAKNQLLPNHLRKRTSKSAKYHFATTLQKRPVKITMYLGLDNITKLKFTTNFDRCAILNVLNCLTKNFEPC